MTTTPAINWPAVQAEALDILVRYLRKRGLQPDPRRLDAYADLETAVRCDTKMGGLQARGERPSERDERPWMPHDGHEPGRGSPHVKGRAPTRR